MDRRVYVARDRIDGGRFRYVGPAISFRVKVKELTDEAARLVGIGMWRTPKGIHETRAFGGRGIAVLLLIKDLLKVPVKVKGAEAYLKKYWERPLARLAGEKRTLGRLK
ncbi:TPA: hypothetical protein EYP44_00545 [Candidatus Bathyarchaeota archaeon]|nr:hypothetical protein [Candidatus Bathyarchaeota archaeon]